MLIMVAAVPIVMQVPNERAMPFSISDQSSSLMRPARFSSQYFHTSEPEPSCWPRQLPRSIGPAGQKMAGSPMEMAPISRPGVVLSQPPSRIAPSMGCERSSSSVSMARKLRYSMVVGLTNGSASEMAGSSSGNPPACSTPRFTSSARARRWAWQALMSLQVLMMPITGLPPQSWAS